MYVTVYLQVVVCHILDMFTSSWQYSEVTERGVMTNSSARQPYRGGEVGREGGRKGGRERGREGTNGKRNRSTIIVGTLVAAAAVVVVAAIYVHTHTHTHTHKHTHTYLYAIGYLIPPLLSSSYSSLVNPHCVVAFIQHFLKKIIT